MIWDRRKRPKKEASSHEISKFFSARPFAQILSDFDTVIMSELPKRVRKWHCPKAQFSKNGPTFAPTFGEIVGGPIETQLP